jgi:hypothetical protein
MIDDYDLFFFLAHLGDASFFFMTMMGKIQEEWGGEGEYILSCT